MSSRDKTSLITLVAIICVIAFGIVVHFGMSRIPWQIIIAVVYVIQCFLFMPKLAERYYSMNEAEIGISKYVPVWNELQIFDPVVALVSQVSIAITAVVFGLSKLPLEIVGRFLDIRSTLAWGYNMTVVFIIMLVITNFVIGFGFCRVLKNVNFMTMDCVGESVSKFELVYYVLLMLPVIRVCPIAAVSDKLRVLERCGYGMEEPQEFIEES